MERHAAAVREPEDKHIFEEYFSMPFCSLFANLRYFQLKCTIGVI